MPTLEIAATTLEEARLAVEGGATSLEICRDLARGGLTPPLDLVKRIRERVPVTLNVMIRVHDGSFLYSPQEMEVMLKQVDDVKALGVDGIVFGALTENGEIDLLQMQEVARAAAPLKVTLHRALDVCRKPEVALDQLVGVVQRILTSGPAPTAWEGREVMSQWVKHYGQHYRFAASGGITAEQLPELVRTVGTDEYHIGGAARTNGMVDVAKVRLLKELIDQSGGAA